MSTQISLFQVGDECLYQKHRHTILGIVWVDPFPGYMTWHIERLLDRSDPLCALAREGQNRTPHTLDEVMEYGIVQLRDGNFYQHRNISDYELEAVDAPPTWAMIDELRAQIDTLNGTLSRRFRGSRK